jgi:hypothetical protein
MIFAMRAPAHGESSPLCEVHSADSTQLNVALHNVGLGTLVGALSWGEIWRNGNDIQDGPPVISIIH